MKFLAIHDGHNSSVCLVENGKIICALQEERFTYVKNQGGIPYKSIEFIKEQYGIGPDTKIGMVGNYMGQSTWTRESVLESYRISASAKSRLKQSLKKNDSVRTYYEKKENARRLKAFKEIFPNHELECYDHHFCHAATAYYGYGDYDNKVLLLTADGEGDGKCATASIGHKGKIEEQCALGFEHSLGRLYSYMTFLFNMVPYEHEYKIMGLAPYCRDRMRIERCKEDFYKFINFKNDKDLMWSYLGNAPSIQSSGKEIKAIYDKHRFDILSAAVQEIVEEIIVEWVKRMVAHFGIKKVALSGGIFMNVKANMLIAKIPGLESVYVFPSCGDDSNPIGLANFMYYQETGKFPEDLGGYYLGDILEVDKKGIEKLINSDIKLEYLEDIEHKVAELLSKGEIVGRVKGQMEFGARSLGNRAILANPSGEHVLRTINDMIKGRDFWMPFAPSLLAEDLEKYFEIDEAVADYEYMIFTCESNKEIRQYAKSALHPYDYTGRPQAVKEAHNSSYFKLLRYYKEMTGESLVLNTSYNLHGFPMVRNQEQAIHVFLNSGLKYLALENYLLSKKA